MPTITARAALSKRSAYRRTPYWTRERIIDALRLFRRTNGCVVLDSDRWNQFTKGGGNAPGRTYPCASTLLHVFPSFLAALEAAGLLVNRTNSPWSPEEDWYLREAAGLITRVEIARDLRRTADAVHRRLYDLGIDSRHNHGWSGEQIRKAAGVAQYTLNRYMLRKKIDWIVGTRTYFFQPADLVVIKEIDWSTAAPDLVHAAKRGHVGRIVDALGRRARRMPSQPFAEVPA